MPSHSTTKQAENQGQKMEDWGCASYGKGGPFDKVIFETVFSIRLLNYCTLGNVGTFWIILQWLHHQSDKFHSFLWQRPYHIEYTSSRPITEVEHFLILSWEFGLTVHVPSLVALKIPSNLPSWLDWRVSEKGEWAHSVLSQREVDW